MTSRSDCEPLPKPTLSPFALARPGTFLRVGFFTAAVWCVPALRVPLVHSLINHFRQKKPRVYSKVFETQSRGTKETHTHLTRTHARTHRSHTLHTQGTKQRSVKVRMCAHSCVVWLWPLYYPLAKLWVYSFICVSFVLNFDSRLTVAIKLAGMVKIPEPRGH